MDTTKKIFILSGIVLGFIVLITILILTNKGTVEVTTEPSDAKVFIDGTEKGKTPLSAKEIKAGDHILEIKKEGYGDIKKNIKVKRGKIKIEEVLERALPSVTQELPRNTKGYVIDYVVTEPKSYTDITYKILIKATLNKITPETWKSYQEEQKKYKTEALNWLREKGVNIEKAKIEYTPKEVESL